jgi:glycosyltransferase involved in cell wall biosynthesis
VVSLRVLQVAYPFAPVTEDAVGGAEVVLARLDAGLCARNVESQVVACEGSAVRGRLHAVAAGRGPIDDAVRDEASARHRRVIEALIGGGGIDVVHLHGVDYWTYLPARHDVPCVVTLHLPVERYPDEVLRAPPAHVRLVCVSESARRRGAGVLDGAAVIENGVPMPRERQSTDESGPEAFVLCLGRICPEKGFHLALDAARAADLPLVLAGRVFPYPDHERYFREEIAPRLDARRTFIGPVAGERKRALLGRAACVVIPSVVEETSSLVAMEALAAGTPVVARPVGALAEIVEPGVTGVLARDVDELARALREAPRLSRARCRAEARRRFDAGRMVADYLALYERLSRSA